MTRSHLLTYLTEVGENAPTCLGLGKTGELTKVSSSSGLHWGPLSLLTREVPGLGQLSADPTDQLVRVEESTPA